MVRCITSTDPYFELSRADLDREPPHYAVGTIKWLQAQFPEKSFTYLMGSDSLRDLPTWHNPAEFVRLCDQIGVMNRKQFEHVAVLMGGPSAERKISLQSGQAVAEGKQGRNLFRVVVAVADEDALAVVDPAVFARKIDVGRIVHQALREGDGQAGA